MKIKNPYAKITGASWLKGNLHAHTTASDGEREHQEVIDDYIQRGYGYLMISDHDIFTSRDDYERFDSDGLILIPGNEVSANGPHLLHVGGSRFVEPNRDRQKVIDDIHGDTGFAIFNHPNWHGDFNHCPQHLLEECAGYVGIEIYNGVISRLAGSPYATNRWDMLLSRGDRYWGFAHDDSHKRTGDTGLGWNMTYLADPSTAGILDSLRSGRFYASTGVEITDVRVVGETISVETNNASRIVALKDDATRVANADSNSITVDVPPEATYIRFECWGKGETFAWTQPFFIEA